MINDRLSAEIALLRRRYGCVENDEPTTWVALREVPLPHGWSEPTTDILLAIPPAYPVTPPDNFFVPSGLRLADGTTPNSYSEGQTLLGRSWGQFSFHCQDWHPSGEPEHGDNLLTFMTFVEARLAELN